MFLCFMWCGWTLAVFFTLSRFGILATFRSVVELSRHFCLTQRFRKLVKLWLQCQFKQSELVHGTDLFSWLLCSKYIFKNYLSTCIYEANLWHSSVESSQTASLALSKGKTKITHQRFTTSSTLYLFSLSCTKKFFLWFMQHWTFQPPTTVTVKMNSTRAYKTEETVHSTFFSGKKDDDMPLIAG